MSQKFIRVYQFKDIRAIQQHLLIYGDLAGQCTNCQAIDLKLDAVVCPHCKTPIKYIAFRNVKDHMPKMHKIHEFRPDITLVDFDDFKKMSGAMKAEDLLK